jgi:glucose-6-phosphate 1-epimerase
MESSSAETDRDLPESAKLAEGKGQLPMVKITAAEASGEMYLHGATVTSWKPRGSEEAIFVSAQSRWDHEHAIRGGVPICFPWFGAKADDAKAPAHGCVRAKAWQLESVKEAGGAVTVSMATESDAETKRWWAPDFRLVHRATFGRELTLELEMTNTGKAPLRFEEALHTYHPVGAIENARVRGLERVEYVDKTDTGKRKTQAGEIAIVSETDRVYLNTTGAVELVDEAMNRIIRLTKENSRATVVWNPWIQKSKGMADFGDDEWKQMICLETGNVGEYAIVLSPGEQHTMRAIVSVEL